MIGLKKKHLLTLLLMAGCVGGGHASAFRSLPVRYSQSHAYSVVVLTNWGGNPPGANDWSCKPSARHPRPVVLVPSTFTSMAVDWDTLSPYLVNKGYCVFSLNYGQSPFIWPGLVGVGATDNSVAELADFVARVQSATGASQVDMVGHSQGGMISRLYIEYGGGAKRVHALVLLVSPSDLAKGVSAGAFIDLMLAALPPFIKEAIAGISAATLPGIGAWASAEFWQKLNAVDHGFPAPVEYTGVASRTDEGYATTVVSYDLPAAANTSRTNFVQDYCFLAFPTHFQMPFSPPAVDLIGNALDPSHAIKPRCIAPLQLL